MPLPNPWSRCRKWGKRAAYAAAVFISVVVLLLLVVVGALRLTIVRNFAIAQVNRALEGVLLGKLRVERVGRLDLNGVAGMDATVFATFSQSTVPPIFSPQ